jgi:hypothetical protein
MRKFKLARLRLSAFGIEMHRPDLVETDIGLRE